MVNIADKGIKKLIVEYEDGEIAEIEKGGIFETPKDEGDGTSTLVLHMCGIGQKEIGALTKAFVYFAMETGYINGILRELQEEEE